MEELTQKNPGFQKANKKCLGRGKYVSNRGVVLSNCCWMIHDFPLDFDIKKVIAEENQPTKYTQMIQKGGNV